MSEIEIWNFLIAITYLFFSVLMMWRVSVSIVERGRILATSLFLIGSTTLCFAASFTIQDVNFGIPGVILEWTFPVSLVLYIFILKSKKVI